MKVSESPPIYCFLLLYCLNFIAQFDKLLRRTLKNSTPEEQTERTNDRFETHPTRFWDFEIGPKFSETHVSFSRYHSIPLLSRSSRRIFALICYRKITVLLWEQAAIRNDFRAGVLIKELYGKVYRHTATRQEQIAKSWLVRPQAAQT